LAHSFNRLEIAYLKTDTGGITTTKPTIPPPTTTTTTTTTRD
jgi:hypothetical protein